MHGSPKSCGLPSQCLGHHVSSRYVSFPQQSRMGRSWPACRVSANRDRPSGRLDLAWPNRIRMGAQFGGVPAWAGWPIGNPPSEGPPRTMTMGGRACPQLEVAPGAARQSQAQPAALPGCRGLRSDSESPRGRLGHWHSEWHSLSPSRRPSPPQCEEKKLIFRNSPAVPGGPSHAGDGGIAANARSHLQTMTARFKWCS